MKVYLVRVYKSGLECREPITAEGADASEAIDNAEASMGLKPPRMSIDKSTGKMSVTGWHGFEFVAQAIA